MTTIDLMHSMQSLLAGRKRSLLADYDRRRSIQRQWNSHFLEQHLDESLIMRGAFMLGTMQFGTIEVESEAEEQALYDFLLYEVEEDEEGETIAQGGAKDHIDDAEPMEREVLSAMSTSFLALFVIREAHPTGIHLIDDLLFGEQQMTLIDRGMGMSGGPNAVFFSRLIRFPRFCMTSGMSLPFPAEELPQLEERARKIMAKPWNDRRKSQELFKKMFHYYRNHGLPFVLR